MSNEDLHWHIYKNGEFIMFNDLDYLNYLLEESRNAITLLDKHKMRFTCYDLEEFNDTNSLVKITYQTLINAEINTLKRILKYESFPHKQSKHKKNNRYGSTSS